ncbi:Oxalate--CoA ligase, partial [Mucuna pruriens]
MSSNFVTEMALCLFHTLSLVAADLRHVVNIIMAFLRHVVAKLPSRRVISVAGKFDLSHSCLHQLAESAAAHISPVEVDAVLLSHPDIAQAVAFGVPHANGGVEVGVTLSYRQGFRNMHKIRRKKHVMHMLLCNYVHVPCHQS